MLGCDHGKRREMEKMVPMTDISTTTEVDELQRLRDVRDKVDDEYMQNMDSLKLAGALEAPDVKSRTYAADVAVAIRDILTAAIDAWQHERDAQRPRTQGPVERALREEWASPRHGRMPARYDTHSYVADLIAALLDELGEPQPVDASEDPEETQTLRELRSAVTRELEVPIDSSKSAIVSALRSRLLPEGCYWPTYADGTPVSIGDRYVNISGDVRTVEYVTVEVGASALCSHDLDDDIYEPGERVRRPAPADTWDQLREDATLPPASYCDRRDVNLDQGWEPSDAVQAMTLDLIDRAERLAKGGE